MSESNHILKRMGVLNCTPDSFSDGGEIKTVEDFQYKIDQFRMVDALDLGAESTAPTNNAISTDLEWERLFPFLSYAKNLKYTVSIDTYHPETMLKVAKIWKDEKIQNRLIWNDVSGKYDDAVREYLSMDPNFTYVLCHNLAPSRELTTKHMDYLSTSTQGKFLEELADYFRPHLGPQIIIDPTLGFSKTYEQNWYVLEHFGELQRLLPHKEWLLGFSRKSLLRRKMGVVVMCEETKRDLDEFHQRIIEQLRPTLVDTVWIRSHTTVR